jgi:chemotaxis-related protein WspB
MLALLFEVAGESYGVPASRVISVVRKPRARAVPGAPPWIAGVFRWRDAWAPLIDLSLLIARTPCPGGAASRVALVEHARGVRTRTVGLLAPGMTRVVDLGRTPSAPGLSIPGQDFLGGIVADEDLDVQMLDVDRVLPGEIDALLFGDGAAGGEAP